MTVLIAALSACGSGSTTAHESSVAPPDDGERTSTTTTAALQPWSFGEAAPSPTPEVDDVAAASELRDGGGAPAQIVDLTTDPNAPIEPLADGPEAHEADPCGLVTVGEWTAWAAVPESSGSMMPLEYGTACGFLTADDTIRLALAVIAGDKPWLPSEAEIEAVAVAGITGSWVASYPLAESSTLVVVLPSGVQLVIEISSRGALTSEQVKSGAIHFAGLALERLAPL